jgi:hypothetical protein
MGWQQEMIDILKTKQHADGSFSNPEGAINKEDDPMLATAMAVIVLTRVLSDPAEEPKHKHYQ